MGDDSGKICMTEFVDGIVHLRGPAKSLDLHLLQNDFRAMQEALSELSSITELFDQCLPLLHGIAQASAAHDIKPRCLGVEQGVQAIQTKPSEHEHWTDERAIASEANLVALATPGLFSRSDVCNSCSSHQRRV